MIAYPKTTKLSEKVTSINIIINVFVRSLKLLVVVIVAVNAVIVNDVVVVVVVVTDFEQLLC